MRIISIFTIALLCTATATRAAISATFVRHDPTPAAIAQDPVLATMQSWLVRVTHTDGDWASAGLRVTLTGGNFYNHAFGTNTQPNPALVVAFPGLQFDTYVTTPTDNGTNGATNVLGGFPTGPAVLSGNLFSVAWGDLVTTPPGTFDITRLTFPSSLGVFEIDVLDPSDPGDEASFTSQVNPDGFALIGAYIPEPSALSVLALTGLMARRRRT